MKTILLTITTIVLGSTLLWGQTSNLPPGVVVMPSIHALPPPPPLQTDDSRESFIQTNVAGLRLNPSRQADQRILPVEGGAQAEYGLQKTFFPLDVRGIDPVIIAAPDGRHLSFRATFLALYDTSSDQSLLLAEVTNRIGAILDDNQVIYTNAFDTLHADIRYRYTKYSLEQDIILHERPALPEEFAPETTRLEIWTEWFHSEPVSLATQAIDLRGSDTTGLLTPSLAEDNGVDFGTMKIVDGHAFSSTAQDERTPVGKRWVRIEGRDWLIETVDYLAVRSRLELLPRSRRSAGYSHPSSEREALIRSLARRNTPTPRNEAKMRMAQATRSNLPEFVMDFIIVSSVPVPSGIISWWPAAVNTNAFDVITNNHGRLVNGATNGPGKVGQGFVFNSTTAYLATTNAASLNPTDGLTIESWVYFTNNNNMPIVNKDSPSGRQYLLTKAANNKVRAHVGITNGIFYYTDSLTVLQTSTWYHVAMTYSVATSNLCIYINGQLNTNVMVSGSMLTTTNSVHIGGAPNWNYYWKGSIDEPSIYNRALGGSEIQAIYDAGAAGKHNPKCIVAPTNIVAWWPGDGNGYDLARTNFATLNNATYESGVVGQGFYFNGTNAGVTAADDNALNLATTNDNLSIEAWIKPLTNITEFGVMSIASKRYAPDSSSATGYELFLVNGVPGFQIADTTGTPYNFIATNDLRGSGYHHVVVSLDRSLTNGLRIYVDGVLTANPFNPTTLSGSLSNSAPFRIGVHPQTGINCWYKGVIDEVTVYRRALDSIEVTALYAAGSAGKCKVDSDSDGLTDLQEDFLDTDLEDADSDNDGLTDGDEVFVHLTQPGNPDSDYDGLSDGQEISGSTDPNAANAPVILTQPQNQIVGIGSNATFSVTMTGNVIGNYRYQWRSNTVAIPGATNFSYTLTNVLPSYAGNYSVIVTNVAGSVTSSVAVLTVICLTPPSGLVGWWQGENHAFDSVSTNHGTALAWVNYTNGLAGSAFKFDGANRVRILDAPALRPTNFTVEAWVFSTATTQKWQTVALKERDNNLSFALYADTAASGQGSRPAIYVNVGGANIPAFGAGPLPTNTWTHLSATYDGTTLKLYTNAVLAGSQGVTGTVVYNSSPLAVGGNAAWDYEYFIGMIDEVSLYNRALTSNEIASIHLAGSRGKCQPATIIRPPKPHLALLGGNTTFWVAAAGSPLLSYQWQFGGADIANATNSTLTLTNLQFTNSGLYSVRVTNFLGSATASASLTVHSCMPAADVMLVMDRSESMIEPPGVTPTKMSVAQAGATNFLGLLLAGTDQAGLISFSDTNTTDQTLTTNLPAVASAVNGLNAIGATRIDYGIVAAHAELLSLRHKSNAFPIMVVLSDGSNNPAYTSIDVQAAANTAKADHIRVISIALGVDADTNLMASIASSTNDYYYATNATQLTNAYIYIAESLCRGESNQLPVVTWISPTNNQLFVTSPTNILLLAENTGGPITEMEFYYYGTNHIGGTNAGPYQILWTNVTAGTYTLRAIGTNISTATVASADITIIVNAMPVVTITTPTQLQPGLKEVTNVTLWAGAYDPDGSIQQVRFYTNLLSTNYLVGVRDGMTTNYSALWSGLLADYYAITAMAIDTNNASTVSAVRVFQVTPTNLPPEVWITYPTNNEVFRAGADITITAVAYGATNSGGGNVTNVEFFADGQPLGSDSELPYSITICCWEPGTYQLAALATDSLGSSKVSTNVTIVVGPKVPTSSEGFWDPEIGNPGFGTFAFGTAVRDSEIYVGGNGTEAGAYSVARWDGTNWSDMSGISFAVYVYDFALNGTNIYAVGRGANNGATIRMVSRWDGTDWVAIATNNFPNASSCYSILQIGSDLFVGGDFESATDNTNVRYIARLNPSFDWEPVGNGLNGPVYALASIGNRLFAGGAFTNAGGNTNANYIAELVDGVWTNLGSGLSGTNSLGDPGAVFALAVCDGELFVGGDFTTAGGNTNANGIAKWDGKEWTTIHRGLAGGDTNGAIRVRSITPHGRSILYVGGNFETVWRGTNAIPATNIAKVTWSEDAQDWTWWDLDLGLSGSLNNSGVNYVWSTAIIPGTTPNAYDLIVSGSFDTAGSAQTVSAGIARWRIGSTYPTNLPSITITEPINNSSFTNPSSITFAASVTPNGTTISYVEFFVNGTYIGSADSAPYSVAWNTPTPDVHLARAVVVDSEYHRISSRLVGFRVVDTNVMEVFAENDVFTIFANSPPVSLPVLTNDEPTGLLKISQADIWSATIPAAGTVAVAHDQTQLIFAPFANHFGTNYVQYSVTNNTGDAGHAFATIILRAKPQVEILAPDCTICNYTSPVSNLTISGSAIDWDGTVTSVKMLTNGVEYGAVAPTVTNFSFTWSTSTPGFYQFVAVAADNDGCTNTSIPVTLQVRAASSPNLPIATITSPSPVVKNLNGLRVTETYTVRDGQITNFIGTARDPDGDPVSYQVLLLDPQNPDATPLYNITPGTLNSQEFREQAVTNASLGTLDLSLVENGSYLLTLLVRGGGDEVSTNIPIAVDSYLKIGQFSFSEQDLVLQVNGIPITITRTYNSLNQRSADFGYSWTYALNSMDVAIDEARTTVTAIDTLEDSVDLPPVNPMNFSMRVGGGRNVTLTLPDGRRTTFQLRYVPSAFNDQSGWGFDAKWVAPPGVTATLTTPSPASSSGYGDNTIFAPWPPLRPFWKNSSIYTPMEAYDIPELVLTTEDGTKFYITRDAEGEVQPTYFYQDNESWFGEDPNTYSIKPHPGKPKLTKIVQRSRDEIRINESEVSHWAGGTNKTRSMFMQRDSVGRVVAIFDPNSGVTNDTSAANAKALVKYVYNRDTGNLIQVHRLQDRSAGNYLVTKYHYDHPNYPHYITSIEDPRGIPLARNEYDDDGRLTAVVDADGKRTEFGHNTDGRFERVIDRGGGTNTFVYDLRGNVTFIINALGVTNRMQYDDKNQKTNEVNALGTPQETWSLTYYDHRGYQTNVITSPDHTNSFRYDDYGNLLWHRNPVGNITTNGYDDFGNLTNTIQLNAAGNPIGGSSSVYENGHLIATVNYENKTNSSFIYDNSGNLIETTDANGLSRGFAYDSNGNQISSWQTVNGIGVTNRTIYDAQGRAIQTIDPLGNTNSTFYNALGKVDYSVDKFGNTNSFHYDTRGNLIRTTDALGLVTYTVYDDAGRAFFATDRNGITATHTYFDAAGRATNVVRVTNAVVSIVAGPRSVLDFGGYGISTNATEYFDSGWVKSRTGPDGAKTTYAYWPDGQTMYVTNAFSTNVTFYKYDIAGRQEYIVNALNRTNRFEYDAAGRMFKTVFHNGTYTSNYYNSLGQRAVVRDQAGLLTQFGYDVSGQLTNVIKPGVIDPLDSYHTNNPSWAYSYDAYGRLHHTTDPLNNSTTNTYDEFGRETTRWLTLGETNWTKYNALGQVSEIWDFKKQKKKFVYDRYGRVATNYFFEKDATYPSNTVIYIYNQLGQLTNITERWGTDASIGYVAAIGNCGQRGRFAAMLATVEQLPPGPTGGALGLILCGVATMIWLTAEARRRRVSTWQFARTLLAALRQAFSALTGERVASTHARTQIPQWLLHVWPSSIFHLPSSLLALCSFATYALRCGGTTDSTPKRFRLPSYGWRFATIITLAALIGSDPRFDGLWTARAACGDEPDSIALEDTERVTAFTYDLEGRLAQVNSPEGYLNYEYDLATGRHTRTCTTNSNLEYGYDDLGRLETVAVHKRNGTTLTPPEVTTYAYTAVGSRQTMSLPNGVVTTWQYDELNRLTNVANVKTSGNELLSQFSYKLDLSGRRTNAVEIVKQEASTAPAYQTNTMTWQYDGLYRLTNEVCVAMDPSASYTNRFQYDLNGNRWSQQRITSTSISTTTNQYNANDQLLNEVTLNGSGTPTATNVYAYDANGSLTAKTNWASGGSSTNLYGYDLKNKLSDVAAAGSTMTNYFRYNQAGIRVKSWVTGGNGKLYLVDANNHTGYAQVLEEFTVTGSTPSLSQSYVLGDDVLAQGISSASYLLYDGHGSTRQLAGHTAAVSSRYNYEAYGTMLTGTSSTPATSLLYCGEQYDSTLNMYNLRARFYAPSNGRFNAMDTFVGNNEDPQSLHKYAYCHGDPVNAADPTGLFFGSLIETSKTMAIIGVVSALVASAISVAFNIAEGRASAVEIVTEALMTFGVVLGSFLSWPVAIFTLGYTVFTVVKKVLSEEGLTELDKWELVAFLTLALIVSVTLRNPSLATKIKAERAAAVVARAIAAEVKASNLGSAPPVLPPSTTVLAEGQAVSGFLLKNGRLISGDPELGHVIIAQRNLLQAEPYPLPGGKLIPEVEAAFWATKRQGKIHVMPSGAYRGTTYDPTPENQPIIKTLLGGDDPSM